MDLKIGRPRRYRAITRHKRCPTNQTMNAPPRNSAQPVASPPNMIPIAGRNEVATSAFCKVPHGTRPMLDCLVVGGGPAGLTAAIYLGALSARGVARR